MKSSTHKILGIEVATVVVVILIVLFIKPGVLCEYLQAGALGLAVVAGIILLGWARPRGSENKTASLILILAAVAFQIAIFVLLGLKLGYVANVYRWNWTSIFTIFLPLAFIVVFAEVLRGQMIDRGRGSRGVVITTAVAMFLLQIAVSLPAYLPLTAQNLCEFVSTLLLPAILVNILLTYIAYQYDYRANIVYRLVMELPLYLLPIYPDVDIYLRTLFSTVLVVFLAMGFFGSRKWMEFATLKSSRREHEQRLATDQQIRFRQYVKRGGIGLATAAVIVFTLLMSGLMHWYFLAVGSGSMEPAISRGDLVLVEKTERYDKITEGEILVYRHKNAVMIHRISKVTYDGKTYHFTTRGDANTSDDVWIVEQSDVIGIAKTKIAVIGYPTVWLNEIFNGGK